MVDAVTDEEVPSEEQIKGYAVGKDAYVQVEDDELANIAIESTHTVDIEKFVPKASIDDRYRDTPVLPGSGRQGRPGSVRGNPRCHEEEKDGRHRPRSDGQARAGDDARALRQGHPRHHLHYPYEIRSDEAVFEEIPELKLPDQMIGLAEDIIDRMSGIRARQIRGPLRERDDRAHPHASRRGCRRPPRRPCPSRQCGQPDGCAPAQHRGAGDKET